jgi:hypothetical protein
MTQLFKDKVGFSLSFLLIFFTMTATDIAGHITIDFVKNVDFGFIAGFLCLFFDKVLKV